MIQWRDSVSGFASRRYQVVLEAPFQWRLSVDGRERSRHRTASAAKVEAARLERLRRRNGSLIRIGAALTSLIVVILVALAFRIGPNPARPDAEALAAEMEAAYSAINSGVAVPGDFDGKDGAVRGAAVSLAGGQAVAVLVGEAGGECYALYWGDGQLRRARALSKSLPCEPDPIVASVNEMAFTRQTPTWSTHLMRFRSEFDWNAVLPSETRQRTWFIPLVLLVCGAGATLVTRASVIALTGRTSPPGV